VWRAHLGAIGELTVPTVVRSAWWRAWPGARHATAALAATVALVASACSSGSERGAETTTTTEAPIVVTIRHADLTRTVTVAPGTSVGNAVEESGVPVRGGRTLNAASGDPISPNREPARFQLDGRPVSRVARLLQAAAIVAIDGDDTTEETREERRSITPEGLPEVLRHVHFPGIAGAEEVTVGVLSSDVVKRATIEPAVPPHRATGAVLALTFDDGPDPWFTPQVLDILAAKGVTATFCMVGSLAQAHPDLARRVVAEGHQLCNHTMTHVVNLEAEPAEVIDSEMAGGRATLKDAAGVEPPYYRPPGGTLAEVTTAFAHDQGETVLYWSLDPRDWKRPPADQLTVSVVNQLEPGAIVLLHDGGGDRAATVAALPAIIDFARALGYTFTAPISRRPQVG